MINGAVLSIENLKTEIEKQMLVLPADKTTLDPHKMYLAGLIQGWSQAGAITEDTHDELYTDYVG